MNAKLLTFPEPTTPLEFAADAAGYHPTELDTLFRLAGWDRDRQAAETGREGWCGRLKAEIVAREIQLRIKPIGPEGLRSLSTEQCCAVISSTKLRKAVAAYVGGSVMTIGKTGVGKTMAALVFARQAAAAIERKRLEGKRLEEACSRTARPALPAAAWISCAELPRLVASHALGSGQHRELERAKVAPVCVLDDLTWGSNDAALLEIIAARYDRGLPSIVTAGATRAELVTRFGDAVMRRLLECRGQKGLLVEV